MDTENRVEFVAEFIWRCAIARPEVTDYIWPLHASVPDDWRAYAARLLKELDERGS